MNIQIRLSVTGPLVSELLFIFNLRQLQVQLIYKFNNL